MIYVLQLLLTGVVMVVLLLWLFGVFFSFAKDLSGLSSLVLLLGLVAVCLYAMSKYVNWISTK